MSNILSALKSLRDSDKLGQYIEYVRFPRFKDIQPLSRIDFEFPFTALVGANGSRKSSVLKGLNGCPFNKSPAEFWFSTPLDPLEEPDSGRKSSIIHAYKNSDGDIVECLKINNRRKGRDEDYWEPSKASKVYDMTRGASTISPITKNVVYLDFRALIPAFDQCFHFFEPNQKFSSAQAFIRKRAPWLKKAIEEATRIIKWKHEWSKKPVDFTDDELKDVSKILGKKYESITLIRHRYFGGWGNSVKLKTSHHDYTEAFAGSGENAIAVLVHTLENAPDSSLVLLDEPEVSLHPHAQKKLREYLLEKIKANKHQIVISTHSPILLEGLPPEAIKVFTVNDDGTTTILPNVHPAEAFNILGQSINGLKKVIWVEDELAKSIVNKLIETHLPHAVGTIIPKVGGGAEEIYQLTGTLFSKLDDESRDFILLDGDKQKPLQDPQDLKAGVTSDSTELEAIILDQTGIEAKKLHMFLPADETERAAHMVKFLEFLHKRVSFIPGKEPEAMIWSDDVARLKLSLKFGTDTAKINSALATINAKPTYKDRLAELHKITYGNAGNATTLLGLQQDFVVKFINQDITTPQLQELKNTIEKIRNFGAGGED